jgi:hypothetical protein
MPLTASLAFSILVALNFGKQKISEIEASG